MHSTASSIRPQSHCEQCGIGVSSARFCSRSCYEKHLTSKLETYGVPMRYQNCRFENFSCYSTVLSGKCEFVKNLDRQSGLFLFGSSGGGKTHLAVASMAERIRRNETALFSRYSDFASRCRRCFSENESPEVVISELNYWSYLVLDDFGATKQSDFLTQANFDLIDSIYAAQKTTLIVTSNFGLGQLEPRIASRIAEMCAVVHVDVEDYRIRIGEKNKTRSSHELKALAVNS
jgi:DNA replication protein DnaC